VGKKEEKKEGEGIRSDKTFGLANNCPPRKEEKTRNEEEEGGKKKEKKGKQSSLFPNTISLHLRGGEKRKKKKGGNRKWRHAHQYHYFNI